MRSKRKIKGGFDNSSQTINFILVGLLLFLMYQITNRKPQIVIQKVEPPTYIEDTYIEDTDEEDEPYRENEYIPDIRRMGNYPRFNYPTRGAPEQYDLVGFLQDSVDPNKLQQLYGRRTYPNSNQWNYFVKSDQYHQIPIPVSVDGKNCTDSTGCSELKTNDNINLLNRDHTATIYKPEPFYYNPYVV